jgi:hypothetical protein
MELPEWGDTELHEGRLRLPHYYLADKAQNMSTVGYANSLTLLGGEQRRVSHNINTNAAEKGRRSPTKAVRPAVAGRTRHFFLAALRISSSMQRKKSSFSRLCRIPIAQGHQQ